jgi:antitoxin HicB
MARARPDGYPVDLQSEDGGFVVMLPDIGYGATQGDDLAHALAQAGDLLEEAVLGMMAHGEEVALPSPAKGRPVVALPALTAAKLEAYRAMRAAGLNKSQLAEKLGWQPSQVTRLFDGRHASRLDQIEAALRVLGRRLVVSSEGEPVSGEPGRYVMRGRELRERLNVTMSRDQAISAGKELRVQTDKPLGRGGVPRRQREG